VAGKTKSRLKTLQTPGKCNTLRDWQFRQSFYGIVNREISGKLVANIFSE